MSRKSVTVAIILAIIVVLAFAAPALAKKGPPTTESTNNLSVPTIMLAGGGFTGVTVGVGTPSPLVPPTGTPLAGYPISPLDYYYVQGVHKWQAQAYSTTNILDVTAAWGDNLTGDAKLKTNSPIRVELGLFRTLDVTDPVASMDGYAVVKLDPAALDRESPYGTLATSDGAGGFFATPTSFQTVRVFDNAVTFSIQNVASGAYAVPPGTKASAEINATGSVVYGYNLRVSVAGDYLITYSTPSVTVIGSDAGNIALDGKSISLLITVAGGGGGGGRP